MTTIDAEAGVNVVGKGHRTLHLIPAEVWNRQRHLTVYVPEAFESDGFIHCTDDADELMNVGNRYYKGDTRDYVALTIACDVVQPPVIYEDQARMFPHIYGPLNVNAVERVQGVNRNTSGEFLGLMP